MVTHQLLETQPVAISSGGSQVHIRAVMKVYATPIRMFFVANMMYCA